MKIIVGCEKSGAVRRILREMGHDAWSVDIKPADDESKYHIQDDVLNHLDSGWDAGMFFPDCTYLTSSGLHWNKRIPGREEKTQAAIRFIEKIWASPIKKLAFENPVGCINTRIKYMPKPQYIQPYQFGDDASKRTGIWSRNLPAIAIDPDNRFNGRIVIHNGKEVERWSNQTDSGQNNLAPSEDRATARGITYPGIAKALAEMLTR